MADIPSKVEFLECENKLLSSQQNNYKELCKVLTERHVEILKYLNHLKTYIEKIISLSKENAMYGTYLNDKSLYEADIVKYDKRIQTLTGSIQSSQARISDNEETLFKEQLKLLSTSLEPSNHHTTETIINDYTKYRCDYFDCSEEFTTKHHLESHLRSQHNSNVNFNNSLDSSHFVNYDKKQINESKISEVLFVPQMELEVLDYNNTAYPTANSNNNTNNNNNSVNSIDKSNGFKKLSACDYCGKYFNKHYLESHKRSHTGAKPFKCSIDGCNRTFTQSSSRNFHEKRFHRVSKYVFKCSYINCETSFDRLEDLQKHMQQHQTLINSVTHSVDISGLKIPNQETQSNTNHKVKKANKSNHIQLNHKHVCAHCGKSFAYKIALRQHSLMHGSKNFSCPYENCNYASYWKHNLGLHLRKHHNAES